jgi:GNAT superfamily N-acetyltransferase
VTQRDWEIRVATPADRERALELMAAAFGSGDAAFASARWDWLFLRNTADARLFYLVADAGDVLAAQYAMLPVRMQHEGAPARALLSLDTATHPAFAKRGLFTTLAERLYESARDEYPLVFGFPNSASAPGFYRKLGWREVTPYPLRMRLVGRLVDAVTPRATAATRAAGLLVEPAIRLADALRLPAESPDVAVFDHFGEWADRLWAANAPALGTCAIRDQRFLEWRYVESPFTYERLLLQSRTGVRGFAVTAQTGEAPRRTTHVMELMATDPADDEAARALLATVIHRARRKRSATISAVVTPRHPHLATFRRCGLRAVPQRWVGARSFGCRVTGGWPGPADRLRASDAWYLSGSDFDFL